MGRCRVHLYAVDEGPVERACWWTWLRAAAAAAAGFATFFAHLPFVRHVAATISAPAAHRLPKEGSCFYSQPYGAGLASVVYGLVRSKNHREKPNRTRG